MDSSDQEKNLKIVFISYAFWPPHFGGELLVSIERFQDLVKRGHKVTVLTSGVPEFPAHEMDGGIEIYRSPILHPSKIGRGFRRLFFPIWANAKLRSLSADVVHLAGMGGLGPFTSMLGNIWINHTAHQKEMRTFWVHSLADTDQEAFSARGLAAWLRYLYLQRVDTIVSVSPKLHEGVSKIFPKKAVQIFCAIRDDVFKPISLEERQRIRLELGVAADDVIFCFLGTVCKRKGFHLLAKAFSDLSPTHPNWRLWVIGPKTIQENQNIDLDEVKLVCSPLDRFGNKVHYWGRIDNRSQLAHILSISDIFVFPSLKEGFGLAPVEAMAVGIPVIISKLPGITDLANIEGETGLFIEPNDEASLKTAMVQLADQPDLRREMGRSAVNRVREFFGWQQHVDRWEQIYQEPLSE